MIKIKSLAQDKGANHFVMWYNTPVMLKSDDEVKKIKEFFEGKKFLPDCFW
jgi:hypothetical protein